jgi:hypothetical protein
MEKGEASASIDPVGSVGVYKVSELKDMGDSVLVPESKEERKVHCSLVFLVRSVLSRRMCQ